MDANKTNLLELIGEIDAACSKILTKMGEVPILGGLAVTLYFLLFGLITHDNFTAMIVMVLITAGIPIAYLIFRKIVLNGEEHKKRKIQFYRECAKLGLCDFSQDYQKQKAELLAKRLECEFSDIAKYYAEAKALATGDSVSKERKRINEELKNLRKAETAKSEEFTRFAGYYGRNKRIAILEYAQRNYRQKAAEMKKSMEYLYHSSQEKEINSGVAGGIASGLLGGVAGVAAYIDAENENAKIRARNKATMDTLAPGMIGVMNSAYEYKREADNLQFSIDDAKIKVVSDISDEKVLSYLSFSNPVVSISKTGAFTIKVGIQVTASKSERMLGSKVGVIDGTIAADMYQRGKKVGRALMVLPTFGVKEKAAIEGISIGDAERNVPYEIKYSAHHLWLMEE